MADGTRIEWADATLNYLNGCTVLSRGCTNCYAMKLAGTRLRNHPSRQGLTTDTKSGPVWTGDVRPHEPALLQALAWKRGRRIFWNAHGDTFHENVPDEWIDRLFAVCALTPQHTHMILTKRSERMRRYLATRDRGVTIYALVNEIAGRMQVRDPAVSAANPECWPLPNVWLGVSVEDLASRHRVLDLAQIPAALRFVSGEPLLEGMTLTDIPMGTPGQDEQWLFNALTGEQYFIGDDGLNYSGDGPPMGPIDWLIVGGEHGPRPMHPDWARSLRDQCAAAGTAFLFKQWGDFAPEGLCSEKWIVRRDGSHHPMPTPNGIGHHPPRDGDSFVYRVGKKRAGRLLDGVAHDAFPDRPEQPRSGVSKDGRTHDDFPEVAHV